MAFDLKGARAAGYTDVEIVAHLAKEANFDAEAARRAGYSDADLIAHLSSATAPRASSAADIPVTDADREYGARQAAPVPPAGPQSVGDKIVGAGETALTLATGATSGAVGMIGGAFKGLAGAVLDGSFGTQEGVRQVERAAGEGASALTYQPRTASGQEFTQAIGEVGAAAIPLTGLGAQAAAMAQTGAQAAQAARVAASPAASNAVARIRQAAPAVAERLERTLSRNPEPAAQRAGGSVGAAGREVADMRRDAAESLPAPIDLTQGQATRNHNDVQFERETARMPAGEKLRERYDEQRAKVWQNFDAFIDATETNAPDKPAVGRSVGAALENDMRRDKAEVRARYKEAENSAESAAPVTLGDAVQFLNESLPDMEVSKVLGAARKHAVRLGIAAEDADGMLTPLPTTIKNAELFRRAVGNATDYEPTNIRNASIIKASVDSATESTAGPLYRNARRARENLANKWENRSVIADLVSNKRGMKDRKVAIEDVFDRVILKSDKSEVTWVKRVLLAGDGARPAEMRAAGQQAWRDLQGQTMRWLRDQAETTSTDSSGNRIPSFASLDRAVKRLDEGGKLEAIFGKKRAEEIRDLSDIVSVVQTVPPGSINTSGTAATLLMAMGEAGLQGALTGLPLPVLMLLKQAAKHRQNVKVQKQVDAALARRPRSTPQSSPQF